MVRDRPLEEPWLLLRAERPRNQAAEVVTLERDYGAWLGGRWKGCLTRVLSVIQWDG